MALVHLDDPFFHDFPSVSPTHLQGLHYWNYLHTHTLDLTQVLYRMPFLMLVFLICFLEPKCTHSTIISHFFYFPHMTQHPEEVGYKWIEGTNDKKTALVSQRVRDRAGIQRNRISPMKFYGSEIAIL